ncbi:MAG: tRNA threonylcarbamoyladenosine biosynthesis protein TsaE [Turneriella sp.]|nr:tRNA threonylcarbamoyladenosine biosynthesis protein TsaE [Turneriella sp.]
MLFSLVEKGINTLRSFKREARRIASKISPPMLVLVSGELGAGKTTLVAEILLSWGISGVTSPTFNIRNDYKTDSFLISHLDFYRLDEKDSAYDILPLDEDYLRSVVFVEWPEKAPQQIFAPFSRKLEIFIAMGKDGSRRIIEKEDT